MVKKVIIGRNDAGQRADKFLNKTFPMLPVSMMYKYLRQKDIKLNGKRCEISTRLQEGDELTLYVKDEFLEQPAPTYELMSAGKQVDIVYEDEHLLLLNKKAGVLVDTVCGHPHLPCTAVSVRKRGVPSRRRTEFYAGAGQPYRPQHVRHCHRRENGGGAAYSQRKAAFARDRENVFVFGAWYDGKTRRYFARIS